MLSLLSTGTPGTTLLAFLTPNQLLILPLLSHAMLSQKLGNPLDPSRQQLAPRALVSPPHQRTLKTGRPLKL